MQLTAIGTVAATVTLLGAFLFVRATLVDLGSGMLRQIEISVYLKPGLTSHQLRLMRTAFKADRRIASVSFVPKAQGLKELRARMRGAVDTALLTENPLPDKFRVRTKAPQEVPAVAASVSRFHGVATVEYGQNVVQRLLRLGDVLRRVGMATIGVFLVVGGIIIANTTRLAVYARRREIAIMQLVGATSTRIRLPFICEGLIVGVAGSVAAVCVLWLARATVWPRVIEALPFIQFNMHAVDVPALVAELLCVGGAIGAIAAWLSVGRHLQA